jgi:riboflavin synthase
MFTGIIEGLGRVKNVKKGRGRTVVLEIIVPAGIAKSLRGGSSLSINGVCLTVTRKKGQRLFFDLAGETQKKTTLGGLSPRQNLNLERALRWGGRLEGHFVLGHVDGVGKILKITRAKNQTSFFVKYPRFLGLYLRPKGSVAVDGVSLTLGAVSHRAFWVHVIPHTIRVTNLGGLLTGAPVNLEADILAKMAVHRSQNNRFFRLTSRMNPL